jgi:hypothetical protein
MDYLNYYYLIFLELDIYNLITSCQDMKIITLCVCILLCKMVRTQIKAIEYLHAIQSAVVNKKMASIQVRSIIIRVLKVDAYDAPSR